MRRVAEALARRAPRRARDGVSTRVGEPAETRAASTMCARRDDETRRDAHRRRDRSRATRASTRRDARDPEPTIARLTARAPNRASKRRTKILDGSVWCVDATRDEGERYSF